MMRPVQSIERDIHEAERRLSVLRLELLHAEYTEARVASPTPAEIVYDDEDDDVIGFTRPMGAPRPLPPRAA